MLDRNFTAFQKDPSCLRSLSLSSTLDDLAQVAKLVSMINMQTTQTIKGMRDVGHEMLWVADVFCAVGKRLDILQMKVRKAIKTLTGKLSWSNNGKATSFQHHLALGNLRLLLTNCVFMAKHRWPRRQIHRRCLHDGLYAGDNKSSENIRYYVSRNSKIHWKYTCGLHCFRLLYAISLNSMSGLNIMALCSMPTSLPTH